MSESKDKKPTSQQIKAWKEKAEKWDALAQKIESFYLDEKGELLPDDDDRFDLGNIGEAAAMAFGWL